MPAAAAGTEHLKVLAQLSRALMKPAFRAAIQSAKTPAEVLEAIGPSGGEHISVAMRLVCESLAAVPTVGAAMARVREIQLTVSGAAAEMLALLEARMEAARSSRHKVR